jgi:hypothetical protein
MIGEYKVKSEVIIPLNKRARLLTDHFKSVSFIHIPREENSKADAIANAALDGLF